VKLILPLLFFSLFLTLARAEEFRAAWIPTVFNLAFPSRAGLPVATQKAELLQLLETAKSLRLNAVLFQVRPESDAVYVSSLEPWSRCLMGIQGKSPGYDPLEYLIAEGKKRGIAVHAWFNPYRAAATASAPRAANHIGQKLPMIPVQTMLWLNPGSRAVQDHVVRVVIDVVNRYDIAGVHLDDYFYPYPKDPKNPFPFPDGKTYQAYRKQGGQLSQGDWRRENVSSLIARLHREIKATKPNLIFGVSPFGIYRVGQPATVEAKLDQYEHLYADPLRWAREGWVDYLAPQLYWADQSPQSFSTLLRWWRDPQNNPRGVPIYPGIATERLYPPHNWPASEILKQITRTREIPGAGENGFIFWQIKSLQKNHKNVRSALAKEI
jgi:uncharacterized lipoprotein YddW (UPF0748 family)